MKNRANAASFEGMEIERLRRRVGRLFAALQEIVDDAPAAAPGTWSPPADVCEAADEVRVVCELPGLVAEPGEVSLTNTTLRVSGRKRRRATRGGVTHLCSARSYGQFSRTVPLRWAVDAGGAGAELKNGLLTVRLPKLSERRGAEFRIEVKDGDG